jgi:hypothetical protein
MRGLDTRPGHPDELFPGVYRGIIEDLEDPELRKRYRVRVVNVHPAAVETQHLPWSELAGGFGGQTFGDIPAYENGDEVWVMFEAGNRRFPVIIGGILNYSGGLTPIPPEQTGADYPETQKRWIRVDRAGNKIEMSPLDEELWVRLVTPDGSQVSVSAADGSILLEAEGRVRISAPSVQIQATEEMNVQTPKLVADVADECTIRGGDVVNVRGATVVNIGEYTPPDATGLGSIPETTDLVSIKAVNTVKIESADLIDVDSGGELQVDSVGKITVHGDVDMDLTLDGNLLLDVEGNVDADIEGTLTVNAADKILVDGQADIEINAAVDFLITNAGSTFDINAQTAFNLHAGADMSIDADATLTIDANAALDITCSASMSLTANAQLTLDAPLITISASSILDMSGSSTTMIDGGVILIG